MKNKILIALLLCIVITKSFAQVTITGDTLIDCGLSCTTLTAHLVGDIPINADITVDDQFQTHTIPIGFTFKFYGTNYHSCLIGPNGTICFDTTLLGAYSPWLITSSLLGNTSVLNSICGPWCDVYLPACGIVTYSTDGLAPNRKFVTTYCHTAMYSCTSQWLSSQIILYETTNIIEVHIGHKTMCESWNNGRAICGVQNSTGTEATVATGRDWTPSWTTFDGAWRFTPTGGGTSYSVAPILYAPIPYSYSQINWYDNTTSAFIDSGTTLVVCPTVTTTYKASAIGCGDTSFSYIHVVPPTSTILGSNTVCVGANISLADSIVGGTWYSTNTAIATITIGGIVHGLSPGIDTIRYIDSISACSTFKVITINTIPTVLPITGANNVYVWHTITLADTTIGGIWSSGNSAIATVSATGVVSGVSPGIDTIFYTITTDCGSAVSIKVITVYAIPISVPNQGYNLTLTNAENINIYPNPATSTLHINAPQLMKVKVYCPDGRKVIDLNATKEVNITNLANGIYFIMLYDENSL